LDSFSTGSLFTVTAVPGTISLGRNSSGWIKDNDPYLIQVGKYFLLEAQSFKDNVITAPLAAICEGIGGTIDDPKGSWAFIKHRAYSRFTYYKTNPLNAASLDLLKTFESIETTWYTATNFDDLNASAEAAAPLNVGIVTTAATGLSLRDGIKASLRPKPELDIVYRRPTQSHHFLTNKSKTWTPQFNKIVGRYGLDLDDAWNMDRLPHLGRHPNAHHQFMFNEIIRIDSVSGGNTSMFLKEFGSLKQTIINNPDMLKKSFWAE
jgi:hypothetical protein